MRQFSAETNSAPPARSPWYAALAVISIAFNIVILIMLLTIRGMVGSSLTTANQNLYQTINTLETYEGYTRQSQPA